MCTTPKESSFDYPVDDTAEDLEEEEIRKLLVIDRLELRKTGIASLQRGFEYVDNRLTDKCARTDHCVHELAVLRAVRAFDAAWAALYDFRADGVRSLSTASARIAPCCLCGQRLHASSCAEPQLCAVRACLLAAGVHVRPLAQSHPQRCAAGVAHAALQQARGGLIDTAPAQATADSRQPTVPFELPPARICGHIL